MLAGLVPVVAGMTWLTQISPGTSYVQGILGPMLLLGTGMGITFVPLTMASLAGVRPEDSGAGSSMVNVTQQVGGALGLAILVTVFGTVSKNARHAVPGAETIARAHAILTHAMASSFTTAAIFDVCALLVIALAIRMQIPGPSSAAATVNQSTRA